MLLKVLHRMMMAPGPRMKQGKSSLITYHRMQKETRQNEYISFLSKLQVQIDIKMCQILEL